MIKYIIDFQLYDFVVYIVTCAPYQLGIQTDYNNTSPLANGGYPVDTVVSLTCLRDSTYLDLNLVHV